MRKQAEVHEVTVFNRDGRICSAARDCLSANRLGAYSLTRFLVTLR